MRLLSRQSVGAATLSASVLAAGALLDVRSSVRAAAAEGEPRPFPSGLRRAFLRELNPEVVALGLSSRAVIPPSPDS